MEGKKELKQHEAGFELQFQGCLLMFVALFFALGAAAGFKEPDVHTYLSSLVPGGTAKDLALVLSGLSAGVFLSGLVTFFNGRSVSKKKQDPARVSFPPSKPS